MSSLLNKELRRMIVDMTVKGRDGHIPSAFSIVDLVAFMYRHVLCVSPEKINDPNRDYFVLSKGHGCQALYAILFERGFISLEDINNFCTSVGILGEHPDCTKVPGVEASTGSLGHGLGLTIGIALANRILQKENMHYVILGDGESQEGSVWEAAHIAAGHHLNRLCAVVDWNESGMQLLPIDNIPDKWKAFGWRVKVINGHDEGEMKTAFNWAKDNQENKPSAIIAKTIKGKGVPELEGHGKWHHRIPSKDEYDMIMDALK